MLRTVEEIVEIAHAIRNINDDIFNLIGDEEYYVSMDTNGYECVVEFYNIRLWSTMDDERDYNEYDEQEPLEPFLRQALNIELVYWGG